MQWIQLYIHVQWSPTEKVGSSRSSSTFFQCWTYFTQYIDSSPANAYWDSHIFMIHGSWFPSCQVNASQYQIAVWAYISISQFKNKNHDTAMFWLCGQRCLMHVFVVRQGWKPRLPSDAFRDMWVGVLLGSGLYVWWAVNKTQTKSY